MVRPFTSAALVWALTVATLPPTARASAGSFSAEILAAHNEYRAAAGVPPLVWSNRLAAGALAWAQTLDARRAFEHSGAPDEGENLWMGTAGVFSLAQMIGAWGQEKRYFRDGTFPDVSATGNWFDVGHYSQMIWRNTTSVGCGGVTGSDGYYRFVCRYYPPGNVLGERVY